MSDTPRTDKVAFPGEWESEAVDAEFARGLEREIEDQQNRIYALERIIDNADILSK